MEYLPPRKKATGNPFPKRGQIKAGIFASPAKTPAAPAAREGKEKGKEGGPGSSASTTPRPRSCSKNG